MKLKTLTQYLSHWNDTCPDKIWLRDLKESGSEDVTWGEAHRQISSMAAILEQKFGHAKRMVVLSQNRAHWVLADLAIITIDEPGFFSDLKALSIGNLPDPLQEVSVYGYPIGGKTLSITKGILSRVEQQIYAHAGAYLLAGQIDAAINPGNSGGPVIVNQEIVGVVMQANAGGRAENLGYFVPPSIIRHVLTDSKDGVNDGFPDLGFRTQTLDSPAAKAAYGLKKNQDGVLVIKVFEDSPAADTFKENDVILRIDEYDIAEDVNSVTLSSDDTKAYLATSSGMQIVDVSTPSTPILLGTYDTEQSVNSVTISSNGNTAYLALVDGGGLAVVNVSDHTNTLIDPEAKMDNKHKGKIEEVIYHGDHTRLRLDLLGNKDFILKVPNSSNRMDIKEGKEINIGWNSIDCRALDPK